MIRAFPYYSLPFEVILAVAINCPIAHPSNQQKRIPFCGFSAPTSRPRLFVPPWNWRGAMRWSTLGKHRGWNSQGIHTKYVEWILNIYINIIRLQVGKHMHLRSLSKNWKKRGHVPILQYTYYIRSKCIKCNTSPIGWFPGEMPGVHCTGSTTWLPPLEKPYGTFLTYISKDQTNTGKTKWRHQSVNMEMCFEWCVISSFNPPTL